MTALLVGLVACATPALDGAFNPGRLARLDRELQALVDDGKRAGLVWAVARNGRIIGQGAHGLADIERNEAMTPDAIFRIYSMTRAVTAVSLLQLVEKGQVELDAPVARYLPELAELTAITAVDGIQVATSAANRPVTIRDLLTYTSGFSYAPQYPATVGVDHRAILALDQTVAQAMRKLASYPLRDQPGARWRYGYHSDVLGAVIETVSGQRIDDYFRQHVFEPLGMGDTGFLVPPTNVHRLVRAYGPGREDITDRLPPSSGYTRPTTFHSAGGGLVSTAADWIRFATMLANDGELDGVRLLNRETARAMRTNQLGATQGPLFWYEGADAGQPGFSSRFDGYGWGYSVGVRLAEGEHSVAGAADEITWGGLANTTWFADPNTGLVALVFAQYLGPDADVLDRILRGALYEPMP